MKHEQFSEQFSELLWQELYDPIEEQVSQEAWNIIRGLSKYQLRDHLEDELGRQFQ